MKAFLAFALLAGCGGTDSLDTCIADRVTIETGVYGQFFNGCDTPDCTASYAVHMEARVYDADPTPPNTPSEEGIYDLGTQLTPIEHASSDAQGFYEIALAAGTHYVCTNRCDVINVDGEVPQRRDWASGPGGGQWYAATCP